MVTLNETALKEFRRQRLGKLILTDRNVEAANQIVKLINEFEEVWISDNGNKEKRIHIPNKEEEEYVSDSTYSHVAALSSEDLKEGIIIVKKLNNGNLEVVDKDDGYLILRSNY